MASLRFTPVEQIPQIVSSLRKTFRTEKTRDLSFRKKQLLRVHDMLTENMSRFEEASFKDLRKNKFEFRMTEFSMVNNDIALFVKNLSSWASPSAPSVDMLNMMDGCQIRYDPLGVVLVIGAWNYPIQVSLQPLVGAIAAGNCAVLKPSEVAAHTAALLTELMPRYLDTDCYQVVNGAVMETTKLLEQRFDLILYTGSSQVGKIIMKAASNSLCPVVLELGGKSPTIVLDDTDPTIAAKRIAWGKFMNSGQTCVAPDYVLCSPKMQPKLIEAFKVAIKELYGEDPQKCDGYGRIINQNHHKRICSMIEQDKVAIGGQVDESDLYISPTVLINCTRESPIMQQEIFGPVLPILTVNSAQEAIDFVLDGEKPLALYVFGRDKKVLEKVLHSTSSGAAITNDVVVHASVHSLPFGGVGNSGMGAYHGKGSFESFSHRKAVMLKDESLEFVNNLRYPPYSDKKYGIIEKVLLHDPKSRGLSLAGGLAVIGLASAVVSYLL